MLQVIVPAFNEEARLPHTLRTLRSYVLSAQALPGLVEVIVVDNASTDATAAVALAEDSPAMRVHVVHCSTPGKGAAVRAGIAASTAEVVAYMDADGATGFEAIPVGLELVAAGADIAVGSRAMTDSVTQARHSRLRAWGAALYRRCTAKVVPGVRDTQCGFKVMRGDVARDLFAACVSDGFSFDVELLGRAHRTRRVVVEFPVTWSDVPGSTFDPVRHGVSSFTEIAQIAWRLRTVAPAPVPLQRVRPVLPAPSVAPVTAEGAVL